MLEGIIINGKEDMHRVYTLRRIACEQFPRLRYKFVDKTGDQEAAHVIVIIDDEDAAVGTLFQDSGLNNDIYILDKIFVKKEYQKEQLGDLVIKMLIDRAFRLGAKQIWVMSPPDVAGFFTRVGFYIDKALEVSNDNSRSNSGAILLEDSSAAIPEANEVKLILTQNKLKKCRH